MRTAITLTKSHAGKWALAASPETPLNEQKAAFRAFRASKSHSDFAEVVYQESDGHREVIRLLTPDALKKIEAQIAADIKAAADFDAEAAKQKAVDPERAKAEAAFKETEKAAAAAEAELKTKPKK